MKAIKIFLVSLGFAAVAGCTNLDEIYYTEVTPNTFFTSKDNVYAVLVRSFTHWRWFQTFNQFMLQEYTTDEMCISTKGSHFSGEFYRRYHWHTWNADEAQISEVWRGIGMGISLAYECKEDLAEVDYESLGLTQATKDAHQMQLQTLVAYFYLRGLDLFGGMPIYYSSSVDEHPRSTDRQTFDFIEARLKEAIPKLEKRGKGEVEEGFIRQGAAAAMLAQLYFNAEAYIGVDKYEECAEICEDLLDGVYGEYALEGNWWGPFTFDNEYSTENMWTAVSNNAKYEFKWYYERFYHYNHYVYFDIDNTYSGNNGTHLQPSLKPNGQPYTEFKLGKPFSKFHKNDLRKKPYVYRGGGKYEGMFLMGLMTNPLTGKSSMGSVEYNGQVLNMVDQVAQFKKVPSEYPSVEVLPSGIIYGEENSGIRLVKMPQPNTTDRLMRWNSDYPVIRLAEVYYMLGECKFRAGDKSGAATLFNEVRKRNFENRADPDPVTADNIDMHRILDEWMIEFIGEQRRRTDLIRWDVFTNQDWWDHKASKSEHLKRFPIPTTAISASNVLEQNPGYSGE